MKVSPNVSIPGVGQPCPFDGPPQPVATFLGILTDGVSGTPIANASVSIGSQIVVTDGTGIFRFVGFQSGHYEVTVNANSYRDDTVTLFFDGVSQHILTVDMDPIVGQISPTGTTPHSPPKKTDSVFCTVSEGVVAGGCSISTALGQDFSDFIEIPVTFDRYFGSSIDIANAITAGLMEANSGFSLEIFDLGEGETATLEINGSEVGSIDGSNNGKGRWVTRTVSIPINALNLPAVLGTSDTKPSTINNLTIRLNQGQAQIAWVDVEISAVRPVVFVHGWTGSSATTWADWTKNIYDVLTPSNTTNPLNYSEGAFSLLGIPNYSVTLEPCGYRSSNAMLLGSSIMEIRNIFGVDKVNLVGHSKGGLDSRSLIEGPTNHKEFVEQLFTVGTPHQGSFLANIFFQGFVGVKQFFEKDCNFDDGAMVELNRVVAKRWSKTHQPSSTVRYASLAGDLEIGVNPFSHDSHGDKVVEVRSALGKDHKTANGGTFFDWLEKPENTWTRFSAFECHTGIEQLPKHKNLPSIGVDQLCGRRVFDWVNDRLSDTRNASLPVAAPATDGIAAAPASVGDPLAAEPQRTEVQSDVINQDEVVTRTIPIDASAAAVMVMPGAMATARMLSRPHSMAMDFVSATIMALETL